MLKLLATASVLLVLGLGIGCGPAVKPKAKVSGEVLLDGKPMAEGEISFVVTGEVPEFLPISGGKFSGEVTHGEKKVEVHQYKEGKLPETATTKTAPRENVIPAKYNSASTMKATVSASGIDPAKFEVKSE